MAPPIISSLSAVKTVQDCAIYDVAVKPFYPQLENFVTNFIRATSSLDDFKQFYTTTNPLVTAFVFSLALAPIFLVVSEVNKNYSQVDRCWSILPTVYALHYAGWAHLSGMPTQRVDLVAFVSSVWTARLTFNYWRRGGYQIGSEDYRWNIIKERIPGWAFFLLNVTFISTMQSVLLMLIQNPTYVLLNTARVTGDNLTNTDYLFAGIMLIAIATSAVADQQQWNYQTAKYHYKDTGKVTGGWTKQELERGFRAKGLWAYSRHPNFAAEQTVWFTLFQWCCWETFTWYNWAGVGLIGYLSVFQGSTPITEWITSQKYPMFKEYKKRVSMFLPKPSTFFTGPLPEAQAEKRSVVNGKAKAG